MKKLENNNLGSLLAIPKYTECYANLAKDRIVFVSEDITKDLASTLSALLFHYDNESNDEISLYINTNGGDASALANIYDVMQMVKSPIKTICIGKAYSAGAFMLAAGGKGNRFMTKNASVMVHGLQCNFPGNHEQPKNSEIYFNFLNVLNRSILGKLAFHTGKSIEEIEEFCKQDRYLNAKEALDYGIIDAII